MLQDPTAEKKVPLLLADKYFPLDNGVSDTANLREFLPVCTPMKHSSYHLAKLHSSTPGFPMRRSNAPVHENAEQVARMYEDKAIKSSLLGATSHSSQGFIPSTRQSEMETKRSNGSSAVISSSCPPA
jgi:hypothetical protein